VGYQSASPVGCSILSQRISLLESSFQKPRKAATTMFARPRPRKSLLPPPAKRRKVTSAVEEINFDFDARADYLTGFHKRKAQRAKQAQEEAAKKAREERIITRKQLREERRQELEEHVEAVNALLKNADNPVNGDSSTGDEEDWTGIKDEAQVEPINHESEYIDEDRYTTVTVEQVDISKDGLHKIIDEEQSGDGDGNGEGGVDKKDVADEGTKRSWPKKRKKKFRYESKAERKVSRLKQKAGNKGKADGRRRGD